MNSSLFDKYKGKVLVSIYYEALCSDSRNFILRQLLPVYNKASRIIEIDLIPYGKATVRVMFIYLKVIFKSTVYKIAIIIK